MFLIRFVTIAYYQKPLLKCLVHKDGLLKNNFKLVQQEYGVC